MKPELVPENRFVNHIRRYLAVAGLEVRHTELHKFEEKAHDLSRGMNPTIQPLTENHTSFKFACYYISLGKRGVGLGSPSPTSNPA